MNATGVAVGNNITATFSEAVHGVSATTFTLRSNAAPDTAIAAAVTRNGTTNQWILNPTADLAANTAYTVTLTGGAAAIRDLANAPLVDDHLVVHHGGGAERGSDRDRQGSGGERDRCGCGEQHHRHVQRGRPGRQHDDVRRPANAAPDTAIAGMVSRNGTTNQWILNPTANLAASTAYTVTLTGGAAAIRDLANAPLATTTWSFTRRPRRRERGSDRDRRQGSRR